MREQKALNICQQAKFVVNALLNAEPYSEDQKIQIKRKTTYIKSEILRRWPAAHREDVYK